MKYIITQEFVDLLKNRPTSTNWKYDCMVDEGIKSLKPIEPLTDEQKEKLYNDWRDQGDEVSYGDLIDAIEAAITGEKS